MKKITTTLAAFSVVAIGLLSSSNAFADYYSYYYSKKKIYEVTVTNITRGESFTPILAATHKRSVAFFDLGTPASTQLADLAESGNIAPLNELLESLPNKVADTTSSAGLLLPGQSVTLTIETDASANRLSLAAMLIPTNDTFTSLNSVKLPKRGSRTYFARAYDAGSEPNDEMCANIPGPACGGEGASPEVDGEGYVHISAGIHGEGELAASVYDWRDAVARVIVKRVN